MGRAGGRPARLRLKLHPVPRVAQYRTGRAGPRAPSTFPPAPANLGECPSPPLESPDGPRHRPQDRRSPVPRARPSSPARQQAVPKRCPAGDADRRGAGGERVITDADGNRLIDFGGGIGVVNAGHRHRRWCRRCGSSSTGSPTSASRSRCTSRTSSWPSGSIAITPGTPREAHLLRQQRRRGGGERHQGRAPLHRAAGDRLLRAWVPRPHLHGR